MKKRDWILIGGLLVLALVITGLSFLLRQGGDYVVVRVDGAEVARYSLSQEGEFALYGGTIVLRIEIGSAYLVSADCPVLLCFKQGKIRYGGQTITCLPNRLTVTVYSSRQNDVDLVAN